MPDVADTELALVLHTHMPYVEGYGTWPFGEEWLWEAMATSYLPLLDVLDAHPGKVTLSITPVLADQLDTAETKAKFEQFVGGVRTATHKEARDDTRDGAVRTALDHSAHCYRRALRRFAQAGGDLLGALAPHVAWTSAATHAVLPLVATEGGVRLQLEAGIASHRERFGGWEGGFWLPECAHAHWLDPLLEDAGVHAACVELTDVDPDLRRPLRTEAGPLLVPIDRAMVDLVWSPGGYPGHAAYRDSFRLAKHDHKAWSNDGDAYDPERARKRAEADAADFVARVSERGGLSVCALDTELLGHWWHEGVDWLGAVLAEAARRGLPVVHLDEAVRRHEPADAHTLPTTTWGHPRDLSTWDGPKVAEMAFSAREAELEVLAAGRSAGPEALRELMALQASDWTFMASRGLAGDYPRARAGAHRAALSRALAGLDSEAPGVRNLAPHLPATPSL